MMLPSKGYFKSLNCPYYESGFCDRPYCYFSHTKRDEHKEMISYIKRIGEEKLTEQLQILSAQIKYNEQILFELKQKISIQEKQENNLLGAQELGSINIKYIPTPIVELKKLQKSNTSATCVTNSISQNKLTGEYSERRLPKENLEIDTGASRTNQLSYKVNCVSLVNPQKLCSSITNSQVQVYDSEVSKDSEQVTVQENTVIEEPHALQSIEDEKKIGRDLSFLHEFSETYKKELKTKEAPNTQFFIDNRKVIDDNDKSNININSNDNKNSGNVPVGKLLNKDISNGDESKKARKNLKLSCDNSEKNKIIASKISLRSTEKKSNHKVDSYYNISIDNDKLDQALSSKKEGNLKFIKTLKKASKNDGLFKKSPEKELAENNSNQYCEISSNCKSSSLNLKCKKKQEFKTTSIKSHSSRTENELGNKKRSSTSIQRNNVFYNKHREETKSNKIQRRERKGEIASENTIKQTNDNAVKIISDPDTAMVISSEEDVNTNESIVENTTDGVKTPSSPPCITSQILPLDIKANIGKEVRQCYNAHAYASTVTGNTSQLEDSSSLLDYRVISSIKTRTSLAKVWRPPSRKAVEMMTPFKRLMLLRSKQKGHSMMEKKFEEKANSLGKVRIRCVTNVKLLLEEKQRFLKMRDEFLNRNQLKLAEIQL